MTGPSYPGYGEQQPPGQQPQYGQQPAAQPQYSQQPGYGQPAAPPPPQQPAYAQNPYGPTGAMAGYTPGGVGRINPGLRVGIVGSVLALIGAVLLILASTGLDWLSGDDGNGSNISFKFSDLHRLLGLAGSEASQPAKAYFSWLAWVLLVAVVLVALLANAPMGMSVVLRPLGLVLGLVGAGLSFWALKLGSDVSLGDELKHASVGFWFAVVGFVLAGVAAVIGPRHVRV